MPLWLPRGIIVALVLALAAELVVIVPRVELVLLVGVAVWLAAPGIWLVRDACARLEPGIAWLVGPALGLGLSVFGLLPWWAAGVQGWLVFLVAPLPGWLALLAARRWGGPSLRLPHFDRRDIVAVALVLSVVPLITSAPYAHVRQPTPDGDAYRAYFTADFVWAMTVTTELAKGDVPPANPFLRDTPLHYYWLSHMLSGAFYRNLSPLGVTAEQVILVDGLVFGLVFVAFLYGLARLAGGSAAWSAFVVVVGFTANSYEGIERLLLYWRNGTSLDFARYVNIDAVTRWYYHGMPVDGLQRMLLYQPHHLTGYMLALTALWLVSFADDITETAVALWAGILLGLGFLFSTFTALVIGVAIALLFAWRLAAARAWRAVPMAMLLGAVPAGLGVVMATMLGYTDSRGGPLLEVGLNATATHLWPFMLLLSFGPLLMAGVFGFARRAWSTRDGAAALALAVAAFFFYFFVNVPDEDGVWVGWRTGHLLLIAFTMAGGALLTVLWARVAWRPLLLAVTAIVVVPAVPTVAIDVYNAQDITNREPGPSFPWTVIITPQEREALNWIRDHTAIDAVVQVAPRAHDSATWTYIQAFAERRAAAGLPGSMIPARPYVYATDAVTRGIFESPSATEALAMAQYLGIDYLVIAPQERARYPTTAALWAARPELFAVAFRNDAVTVYDVRKR